MTTEDSQQSNSDPDRAAAKGQGEPNLQDLMLDLNFVPTWARRSATLNPYEAETSESFRGERGRERGRDDRSPRRDRKDRRPSPKRDDRAPRGDRGRPDDRRPPRGGDAPARAPSDRRDGGGGRPPVRDWEARRPVLPVEIAFIPVRERLGGVVRQLHMVKRAFPLHYLAGLFLDKPEHHLVKIELKGGKGGSREQGPRLIYQAKSDQWIALDRKAVEAHLLDSQLETMYTVEDTTVEAPTGNFQLVGRYRPTGDLLGPPNHHAFQEKLMELHRTHAPDLPLDAFRQRIEMVREPEVIEQWKQAYCVQRVYKRKDGGDDAPGLSRTQAEQEFMREVAPSQIQEVMRAVIPATVAMTLTDEDLRGAIRQAWTREDRFPLSMILALRAALKHMRMHLFKVGKGETYATSIVPKPLEAEHVIEPIRKMLDVIAEHPGWTRKQLVEKLCPGKEPESPEVVEFLQPLGWLIEKGHVIEFFNGALSIPGDHKKMPSPTKIVAESIEPEAPTAATDEAPPATDGEPEVSPSGTSSTPPEPQDPPGPA